jgi:predicted enzyme related to lactoylglutathione lyase
MISNISHISLLVNNYDEAIVFYIDKLGFVVFSDSPMPEMGQDMRWVVISPKMDNQTMISLCMATKEPTTSLVGKQTGGYPLLTVFTDDIEDLLKVYIGKGVKIIKEIGHMPWGKDMIIEDLYGNQIYIVEEPKTAN